MEDPDVVADLERTPAAGRRPSRRPAPSAAALLLAGVAVLTGLAAVVRPGLSRAVDGEPYPENRAIAPLIAADGVPPTPSPTLTPTPTPTPAGPAVYLTFDDGPDPRWTTEVLHVLGEYDAEATFFFIGVLVDRFPDIAELAAGEGHAVGIHGYSHADLARLSPPEIARELGNATAAVEEVTGGTVLCLRTPYGSTSAAVRNAAATMELDMWFWTVDPLDWTHPGAGTIAHRVISTVRPDSVVLLHDGGGDRGQTVAALRSILAELSAQGYRFAKLPC